jgi:hypothetical protein
LFDTEIKADIGIVLRGIFTAMVGVEYLGGRITIDGRHESINNQFIAVAGQNAVDDYLPGIEV